MRSVALVSAALFCATQLHAGLTYRVEEVSQGVKAHRKIEIIKSDNGNTRSEIVQSDDKWMPSGAIVLGAKGSHAFSVLDPVKKTYWVLDGDRVMTSSAALEKKLGNVLPIGQAQIGVVDRGAGEPIEGYPTHRWDAHAVNGALDMTMHFWMTDKIPTDAAAEVRAASAASSWLRAIADARSKMKGFPLRLISIAKFTVNGSTMTQKSTMNIVAIHHTTIDPSEFVVPAGYTKVASPIDELIGALP